MKVWISGFCVVLLAFLASPQVVTAQDDVVRDPVAANNRDVENLKDPQPVDRQDGVDKDQQIAQLQAQVSRLAGRVDVLERLLLTRLIEADPNDIGQLQRRVEVAKDTLAHSQKLFDKGYVADNQLQADRYGVERAELRLELARMASDRAESAASLQMLDARAELNMAKSRLASSVRLAARGYITEAQLRADELAVEIANTRVESIRRLLQSDDEEPNGQ